MLSPFNKPVPGFSLTQPPKGMPFERPPEIDEPDEAVMMHIDRLSDEERVHDLLDALQLDIDVVTMTKGILRSAVAEGVHSIDVALLIAPVVHEYIKSIADEAGIEYEEGLVDKKAQEQKRKGVETQMILKDARKILEKKGQKVPGETPPVEEEPMPNPRGLMSRPEEMM